MTVSSKANIILTDFKSIVVELVLIYWLLYLRIGNIMPFIHQQKNRRSTLVKHKPKLLNFNVVFQCCD